jgi:glycosyltransferase involved in cell wall biosynthesis
MLSILIPIYQENCVNLINDLLLQAKELSCQWEILVFDDCSPIKCEENKAIAQLPNVEYRELSENLGRSRIRNLLADTAKGDILIFLDGDSGIVRKDFLKRYLQAIETKDVVRGGTVYCSKDKCPKGYELHWKYGTKVESNRTLQGENMFTTNNFCIRKKIFSSVRFRQDIKGYGHEDTLFKLDLEEFNFSFQNIDNPVEHLGLKTFKDFISSNENAVKTLRNISKNQRNILKNQRNKKIIQRIKIVNAYNKLEKYHLVGLYILFYKTTRRLMLSLLAKKNPSLFIWNLYKLGVYCKG